MGPLKIQNQSILLKSDKMTIIVSLMQTRWFKHESKEISKEEMLKTVQYFYYSSLVFLLAL